MQHFTVMDKESIGKYITASHTKPKQEKVKIHISKKFLYQTTIFDVITNQ